MTRRCAVLYGNDTFNVKIERRCEIRGIALRVDNNDNDKYSRLLCSLLIHKGYQLKILLLTHDSREHVIKSLL